MSDSPPALRPKLVVGNWKMNGRLAAANLLDALAKAIKQRAALSAFHADDTPRAMVVCPPFTLLETASRCLSDSPIILGAQDCHPAPDGPFTGDVSAAMIAEFGARYVLVGHSERRAEHKESHERILQKAMRALDSGLTPILCVGESANERARGETAEVILRQVVESWPKGALLSDMIVSYEPIWSIGTGQIPEIAEMARLATLIRHAAVTQQAQGFDMTDANAGALRVLYGGSVRPNNAGPILAAPGLDGVLVGGASLDAEAFLGIFDA